MADALRVALISTQAPGSRGSMGIYADMVLSALQLRGPSVQAVHVALRHTFFSSGRGLAGRLDMLLQIATARAASRVVRADVYHLLDGSFGYMATGLPMRRTLVTVHDLIPALQVEGRFPVTRPGWPARMLISSSLGLIRSAGAVHAISTRTARDVQELTGRSVDAVIPNALRPIVAASSGGQDGPPYVLHVGHNGFYKNRAGVLDIFAVIAARHPSLWLAMAGPPPSDDLLQQVTALGLGQRVRWVLSPGDEELAGLYRQARLLLFPSLYEGFGWPPLEALQHGCPVVCADTGSLPEVVGEAALLWAPQDIRGFAAQALRLLDDEALARSLVARGQSQLQRFTLQQLADGLVPLYTTLASA
jgi:glycosyltransferase involved in cell wall biosynthesis